MKSNLPTPITPFIGRRDEIEAIAGLLGGETCRLLTLVGPGGVGKTRLAIEAAAQCSRYFPDGVYFITLQAVTTPDAVVYAIAEALDFSLYESESPPAQLIQYLQRRRALLVLDNFEHLLEAAAFCTQILETAPDCKLLVTSREVLNLQGEHIFEVDGLAISGDDHAAIEDSDAVQLFVSRASQVKHDFSLADNLEAVARICRLVGGLPLGIELAAAWTRTLSCAEIASEIEHNLDFLATGLRDVPERHRSMRAVFEYSWARLSPEAQRAFRRLSVFKGQFDRAAVQAVTDASLQALSALVDQSLLRVNAQGHYAIHELLRQYGLEKLAQDPAEHDHMQERHSAYYLDLLHRIEPKLKSGEQSAALDQIEFGLDNVKAAWAYAAARRRHDLILMALETLTLFFQMRCRLQEGLAAFSSAASAFADGGDEVTYGWLLLGQGWFSGFHHEDDSERITTLTRRVIDIIERHEPFGFAAMLYMALWWSQHDDVIHLIQRNLAAYQEKGDTWGIAWSTHQLGSYQRHLGHPEEAKPMLEAALAMFERLGDLWSATWPQSILGLIAEDEGRYADAYQLYSARLQTCEEVGDAGGVAWSLQQIAKVSLLLDDPAKARYYCRESLKVALDISSTNSVNEAILRIISMYAQTGQQQRAAALCAALQSQVDSSTYKGRRLAQQIQQLQAELPPDILNAATDAGYNLPIRDLGWALLDELADAETPVQNTNTVQNSPLSERELEVLRLAADGLSNREIAERLVVTLGTVKKHLNNIYSKLGVERRTEAVARARQQALIS